MQQLLSTEATQSVALDSQEQSTVLPPQAGVELALLGVLPRHVVWSRKTRCAHLWIVNLLVLLAALFYYACYHQYPNWAVLGSLAATSIFALIGIWTTLETSTYDQRRFLR